MKAIFKRKNDGYVYLEADWLGTIPEFKVLLDRSKGPLYDKNNNPSRAMKDFTYIFLMYDFDSPYFKGTTEERERLSLKDSGLTRAKVNSDEMLQDACRKYQLIIESRSPAIRAYRQLQRANEDKLMFLAGIDLGATTDGGTPKWRMREVDDVIKAQPQVLGALKEVYTLAQEEVSSETTLRGEAIKGYDEDPE